MKSETRKSSGDVADIKFTKRFSANLITNLISLVLSTLVGLLLVPYFIDSLGEAAYGLIPLATSITTYVTLLIDALNVATSRYLMFDLRSSNIEKARTTFSTALTTTLVCVLILCPVAVGLAFLSPYIFNIGDIAASDVVVLFLLIFVSALLNMVKANFTLALYSYNRIDLKNYVSIFQTVLQMGLIILLFTVLLPSLISIGTAYLIAAVFSLLLAVILSKRCCRELAVHPKYVSKECFTILLSMTWWTLVKYGGILLRSNIGLIIANIICGVIAGAEYAIILMWQTMLLSIVGSLSSLFIPNIYSYCAKRDTAGLYRFVSLAVRTTVIAVGILVGLLAVYPVELFTVWVGSEFADLSKYVFILLFPIIFRSATDIINNVMIAELRVRENSLIYCFAGVITAIASLAGAYFFGLFGIISGAGLVMIFCESLMLMVRTAPLLQVSLGKLLKLYIPGILALIITVVVGSVIHFLISGPVLLIILVGGGVTGFISSLISLRLLTKEDRDMVRSCLPGFAKKIVPRWIL